MVIKKSSFLVKRRALLSIWIFFAFISILTFQANEQEKWIPAHPDRDIPPSRQYLYISSQINRNSIIRFRFRVNTGKLDFILVGPILVLFISHDSWGELNRMTAS